MSDASAQHAPVELLSAYLDERLPADEARRLDAHLESCGRCRERFEGMRRVVGTLRRVEPRPLPPTLDQTVARRIALSGQPKGLLDRLEANLSRVDLQPNTFVLFAVIMALALFGLIFSHALERARENSGVPVIFTEPPAAAPEATPPEVGARQQAAGRTLVWTGEIWLQEGVELDPRRPILHFDSRAGRELFANWPQLEELARLSGSVVVEVDGQVLELYR